MRLLNCCWGRLATRAPTSTGDSHCCKPTLLRAPILVTCLCNQCKAVLLGSLCSGKLQGRHGTSLCSFGVIMWEVVTHEIPVRGALRSIDVPKEAPAEVSAPVLAHVGRQTEVVGLVSCSSAEPLSISHLKAATDLP